MVALPSVRVLQKIMTSMKHIGAKTIVSEAFELCDHPMANFHVHLEHQVE